MALRLIRYALNLVYFRCHQIEVFVDVALCRTAPLGNIHGLRSTED